MDSNNPSTDSALDLLLQKSGGHIGNLDLSEKQELSYLLSLEIAREHKQELTRLYPGRALLGAILSETAHQQRITLTQLRKKIGISQPQLSQIMNGITKPGMHTVRKLRKYLRIDGNILIDHT